MGLLNLRTLRAYLWGIEFHMITSAQNCFVNYYVECLKDMIRVNIFIPEILSGTFIFYERTQLDCLYEFYASK